MAPSIGKLCLVLYLEQEVFEGQEVLDKYKPIKSRAGEETVPIGRLRTQIPIFSELE